MKGRTFSLKPFHPNGPQPRLNLTCSITRLSDRLSLSYLLLGPPEEIVVPMQADVPSRRYGLWEETCFEFFIGTRNSEKYWEFNLAPSGNWNVYLFASYRQGMQEEPAFTSLPFSARACPDGLRLSLKIDLGKIFPADQTIRVAVSAVIKDSRGGTTYWALEHPGPKPDFHLSGGFIVDV